MGRSSGFTLSGHALFFSMFFYSWHITWFGGGVGFFWGGLFGFFFGCFFEKGHSSSEGLVSTAATLFGEDTAPIRDTCLGYNKAGKDYFYSGGKGETGAAHIPLDWKHFKESDIDIHNC